MSGKTIFWIGIVVVVVIALPSLLSHIAARPNVVPETTAVPEQTEAEETAPPAVEPPSRPRPMMTQEQFYQITSGMTYNQCVAVAGCDGEVVTPESGSTEAVCWQAPDGRNEFTISFRNGQVCGRSMNMTSAAMAKATARHRAIEAQTRVLGLEEVRRLEQAASRKGQTVAITLDEFQRLEKGMTYDQCVVVIGEENPMAAGYAARRNAILSGQAPRGNNLDEGYQWKNPGGYYAQISFHNGRMTEKVWKIGPLTGDGGSATGGGSASGSTGS